MPSIDLNADLGEGCQNDSLMIALVSSANIACGGYAGDESTMREAVSACLARGVAVGAHPGYEDPEHFGRRELDLSHDEVAAMVSRQIRRLTAVAGDSVRHVKLHGALYHQADRDDALAAVVAEVVAGLLPGCGFFTPHGGGLAKAGKALGLRVVVEAFADRRYTPAGGLISRNVPGAVIMDIDQAVAQAVEIATMQRVRVMDGVHIRMPAETICVHGDNATSLETLHAVREALVRHGHSIKSWNA